MLDADPKALQSCPQVRWLLPAGANVHNQGTCLVGAILACTDETGFSPEALFEQSLGLVNGHG